ncbi:hypothetical protein V8G54_024151, partial [Vigna mungo]
LNTHLLTKFHQTDQSKHATSPLPRQHLLQPFSRNPNFRNLADAPDSPPHQIRRRTRFAADSRPPHGSTRIQVPRASNHQRRPPFNFSISNRTTHDASHHRVVAIIILARGSSFRNHGISSIDASIHGNLQTQKNQKRTDPYHPSNHHDVELRLPSTIFFLASFAATFPKPSSTINVHHQCCRATTCESNNPLSGHHGFNSHCITIINLEPAKPNQKI